MNKFLKELKDTKVINNNDIKRIKQYINIKFFKEDSKNKSYMLSSTIHDIINSKLEGFPSYIKKDLKNIIFKNTFLSGKDHIQMYDIFYSYINYQKLDNEQIGILLTWINNNIKIKIDRKDLEEYLIVEKIINPIITTNSDKLSLEELTCDLDTSSLKDEVINNNTNIDSNINSKFTNIKEHNTIDIFRKLFNKSLYSGLIVLALFLIVFYVKSNYLTASTINKSSTQTKSVSCNKVYKHTLRIINPNIPKDITFSSINEVKLKNYLSTKKSMLAKEPYFSSIINSAKEFDINPLLLFAITGQEQNFVPENNEYAKKIANNPFNVFHSWKEYNTNIKDTSKIAAKTVFNLLKDMPKGENPFKWINKKYAEDKNWYKGVQSIYKELYNAVN
ncbi:glucosaminidase domain-containing protein [Clostridium niameyense]|uniref:glucosaminidase domain-containing protein n=1 Tax=Clostridium niameyense TaxID=1622073 RepID=UPI00067ECCA0|nr:glucosaminidase domain-containing protein [Clostridium niameyense]